MTGFRARTAWFAGVSAMLLIAACSDSAPEEGARTSAAAPKPTVPKATAGAQMVAAVAAGKTVTAVGVHFSLGKAPRVGTALPVEIAVIAHEPFTSLRARFEGQDGLTVVSGQELAPQKDVKAETVIGHQLTLTPAREGVFMVTVNVDTEGKEGIVSRIFSIPVIVAPAAAPEPAPAAASAAETAAGEAPAADSGGT